ncbi:PKD domain containing protein [Anaeromyxobacter sp. K]|uniref:hypothetical protein n=1 Tax=Anaeromyxobacter sp. (strain K) TaxID=447217 RepID=UPI00015F97FB|nr:hypothetical protein [Anaeromyxobacter sp. K]ACG73885.1 PKD domain containing protein [Anaeromyxobacter sp. K]
MTKTSTVLALALALVMAGCGGSGGGGSQVGQVVTVVRTDALTAPDQVTAVRVFASPANVTQDLAHQPDGTFGGVLTLPVGVQTITVSVYAGQSVVGTGAATVAIQANAASQVTLRIVDSTGPGPTPGQGPIIVALSASKMTPLVGESIALSARVVAPAGAGVTYAWSQDCASGTFTTPAAESTSWSSSAAGACALTLTATANGLADASAVAIQVLAPGSATGSVSIVGTFVPRTTIGAISAYPSPTATVAGCTVSRTGADGTCRMAVHSGQTIGITLDPGAAAGAATYALRDGCGGAVAPGTTGSSFQWTAPSAGGFCVLTATKVEDGVADAFAFGLYADPVLAPSPRQAFDWTPHAVGTTPPPHAFVEQPTTAAHVVWSGTTFADTHGRITFVPQGALPSTTAVGLWSPAETLVGPWATGATRFVADAAHGARAVDTSGDFTVCVKFKPGLHPGMTAPNKTLVARGQAEFPTAAWPEGWALMQMHEAYCFHYLTATAGGAIMSPDTSVTPEAVETYAFDYVCGGRAGGQILAGAHGQTGALSTAVATAFSDESVLPLSIGSYPAGDDPTLDASVYEVIFDTRPATVDTFRDIVGAAEGTRLANGAVWVPRRVTGETATGADGQGYLLPPYANPGRWPVPVVDGTVAGNAQLAYRRPLAERTSTTGYCLGAELVADGAWADVGGIVLTFIDDAATQSTRLYLDPRVCFATEAPGQAATSACSASTLPYDSWPPGSLHRFTACADATTGALTAYVDGAATSVLPAGATGGVPDLSSGVLTIGASLGGASISRVFACPFADAARCQ